MCCDVTVVFPFSCGVRIYAIAGQQSLRVQQEGQVAMTFPQSMDDVASSDLEGEIKGIRKLYSAPLTDLEGLPGRKERAGKFVVLEGLEATGKAALSSLVAESLCKRGLDVILSREPGGAPGAEAIRRLLTGANGWKWGPATELLLHAAQRLDHLQQTVVPALHEGVWVVCDGYVGYSVAHLGFGHRLGRDAVLRLHLQTTGGLMPDLVVLLTGEHENDVTPPIEPLRPVQEAEFYDRVAEGYLSLIEDPAISAVPLAVAADLRETAERVVGLIDRHLGMTKPAA